ncbi:MAG: hypothetical protein H6740_08750 [Alphaproteobacteria bacterium]|nr:hypothetical protein [Alphaproteobacteria bacterium]
MLLLLLLSAPASAIELERSEGVGSFDFVKADLGGFIQPRYTWSPDDPDADTLGESGFTVRRARAEFSGVLGNKGEGIEGFTVRHKISFELMPEARLVDAYLDLRFLDPVQLRIGQFKAPTNRSFLTSDRYTLFPDRGEIVDLVPQRQMGVALQGKLGKNVLRYELGVFNGEGTNRLGNVNRKFLYAGRVELSPFGAPATRNELLGPEVETVLTFGYSVNFNVIGPELQEEASIQHNVDAYLHWRWITAQGELLYGITDWQDVNIEDFHEFGWYGQAGVFMAGVPWAEEHLALLGRVEQVDPFVAGEGSTTSLTGAADPAQNRRSYAMGLGFYAGEPFFDAAQDLRFTATYEIKTELEGLSYDNNELLIGAHISF